MGFIPCDKFSMPNDNCHLSILVDVGRPTVGALLDDVGSRFGIIFTGLKLDSFVC